MTRRLVYRVERTDGVGPFEGDLGVTLNVFTSYDDRGPPGAYDDFRDALNAAGLYYSREGSPVRFGCPDLGAARFWFGEEALAFLRREARKAGEAYTLTLYEVPDFAVVEHRRSRQCAFDSRVARPLARMALDRLHADRAQWELPL